MSHVKVLSDSDPSGRIAGARCQHCGEELRLILPVEATLFLEIMQLFINRHEPCPVPTGKTPNSEGVIELKVKPIISFDPLDVPCRYCGSPAGVACVFPERDPGSMVDYHVTRVDEARERAVALHEAT